MSESKKFAFDVGITFIASVISMILGFVITILLGRYFGAGDLGLYRMASTIYGIVILVAAVGFPAAMIKYVAEYRGDRERTSEIVSSGVITSLFLGLGFSVLFYFSSGIFAEIFKMPELSGLIKLLSPVFPFAMVNGSLFGLLNGLREMKKYGIATIVQSVLMVVITVLLIYYGFGIAGTVIGMVLSSVGSCLYLVLVSRCYFEITHRGYIQTTKMMFSFGWKIVASNSINQINYQADTILIGYFLTATDVGYYGVALVLSKFFWLIPSAIQTITYPATSEYWSNNNHLVLNTMIEKSMKYTAYILLPIGIGVGFFAKEIIILIFGAKFIYAVLPLQILIVGTVIAGIEKSIGSSLTSIGRIDVNLQLTALGAIVDLILNLLLIPRYGIVGAAIATITSYIIGALLTFYFIIKFMHIKINVKWYALITMITGLVVALFLFSNKNHYVTFLLLSGYCIVLAYLFNKEEGKNLKLVFFSVFRKMD